MNWDKANNKISTYPAIYIRINNFEKKLLGLRKLIILFRVIIAKPIQAIISLRFINRDIEIKILPIIKSSALIEYVIG